MANMLVIAHGALVDSINLFEKATEAVIKNTPENDPYISQAYYIGKSANAENYSLVMGKLRSRHSDMLKIIRMNNEPIQTFLSSFRAKALESIEQGAKSGNIELLTQGVKDATRCTHQLVVNSQKLTSSDEQAWLLCYAACFLDLARIKLYMGILFGIRSQFHSPLE